MTVATTVVTTIVVGKLLVANIVWSTYIQPTLVWLASFVR